MDKRKTEVRELWAEGIPVKEIIKRTGTLRQTIWRWTRDLPEPETRVKLTRRTPKQETQREAARALYSNGSSLDKVSVQLDVSKPTVYGWIKDLVAKNPNRENNQGRRYKVNDEFFKDPNVINSYWAGLLAGDGNVINGVIRLSLKDRELIDGFKAVTKFAGKVREYKAPRGGQMYSVAISSSQWVKNLQQFNVVPNKSHTLSPPDLEHPLNLAYLKGLYDADGCLTHNTKGLSVWKVSGTRMTCEWVRDIATKLVPEHHANVNVNRNTTHDFTLVGSRAVKMLKALHAIKTPELSRKWPTEIL
ncbi:hypothetical protein LCGC14_0499410 [marine sediment metagenome]|uniref:DOD-type homing endonuclease domain-containing protein n=1 Tax=marine sediment metagenome TaxID=412755 RepID=A0A0F9URD4_9ZZZZ